MRIAWITTDVLEAGAGHGVDFFTGDPINDNPALIGVLRGFDWLHGAPDVVEVLIRRPSADFDEAYLEIVRLDIERYLTKPNRVSLDGRLSDALWAHVNG